MFETVLLPTDFSPDSQKVLAYVKDIPGTKKVVLYHVVDATRPSLRGWEHGPKIENAKILLDENRQVLERDGREAHVVVEVIVDPVTQGTVPLAILNKAEACHVSLIMMGARGRNTIREILLGSVSAGVVRSARIPVLLMRFPPGTAATGTRLGLFSRILVPVDFSDLSRNAFSHIPKNPVPEKVILLHVVDKGESEDEIQAAVGDAREKLAAMEKDPALAGLSVTSLVHVGYPPDDIVATADREDVTMILMSPQGEGWARELRTLFLGSTTNAVVRRASRPVLITAGDRAG
ncbi:MULTISPECIES: universal stress protein [unclassified Methanoregula]|uniref:universal stress protein n=1 Tax=unclassified Methanoregula TaxID=2649730 RepID=UPI0009D50E34|nr:MULTISPECIES: universal stress protein [unclassified Methanoregula]OPX64890.1 MAG: Universal stress protein [Methanoregula sp. PtaB.Bin085]OPY32942.1 MAG: Universal stress protein [Methanoregula sp. PtaU1.Bin006]